MNFNIKVTENRNAKMTNLTVSALTFLQNAFLTSAMIFSSVNFAFAQNGKLFLQNETKVTTTIDMVSSQYGAGTADKNNAPAKTETRQAATQNNTATASVAFGDDKYLKTKEAGKKYTEFKVMDVKGLDKDAVMRGMMTGSFDRDTRYNDKGAVATKTSVSVINGTIAQKDAKGNIAKNGGKVNVAVVTFKDKVFVILGEHDYRYMDGKRVVGDQKLVDELLKGKPVTETTFFFELKKVGIVDSKMTLTQFTNMDLNQQQMLLNGVAVAANF